MSSHRPWPRQSLLRRLVVFAAGLALLGLSGLGLLLFRWSGERGALPGGRLYVHGDFPTDGALVVLERDPQTLPRLCYAVDAAGVRLEERLCRGRPVRVRIGDALLDLRLGSRGVPRLSVAGVRARDGDWLGSQADPNLPGPRIPLRAYGVPGLAARVVTCPTGTGDDTSDGELCLEGHDRLSRLAIVRSGDGTVETLARGAIAALRSGDVLWLGLVPFSVSLEDDGDTRVLALERAAGRGGDRRWLGRLWHSEAPDLGAEVPERFEVHSMTVRYTPHHLSRQRTSFEGEDVLQRLIDGGWLCLEDGDGAPRIAWRPFDRPGCGPGEPPSGPTLERMEDYRRARHGDLSYLAGSLVHATNAALSEKSHLRDATALAFAFDWALAQQEVADGGTRRTSLQPTPRRLWGVRFGATRQVERSAGLRSVRLPTVLPRSTTGHHVVQVLDGGGELLASFSLPAAAAAGSICLGRHTDPEADAYRPTSGRHFPLGSVAFSEDPGQGTWSADADAGCAGCRLDVARGDGGDLTIEPSGECGSLGRLSGGELAWGSWRLRHVRRGERPWLAATDPGTGRRHFAEELYLGGGLRPVLGDPAGLSGVEAALLEYVEDAAELGLPDSVRHVELAIDGDLQLAASAVVEALARPEIGPGDPDPRGVSVTAAILDANGGDVLAAVSYSTESAGLDHRRRATSWELGSGQAGVLENPALRRRGPIGSTMKITGAYALVNSGGLVPGDDVNRRRRGLAVQETQKDDGILFLDRAGARERPSPRRCSTGPHFLPASDAGFTAGTFVRRFAGSCNNFFVLTGFRHATSPPARLREPGRWPDHGARGDELLIDAREADRITLVEPASGTRSLVDRLRDGLAADFAAPRIPRTLYGVLFRLGFQPRSRAFPVLGRTPAELAFEHQGERVAVPLVHDWFTPSGALPTPALRPGRDFSYPGVPSPGRLDETTLGGDPAVERYDGVDRNVRRLPEGRADVQYSMLMIGQSSVEASAVGLATLYAPVARADGRAVSPCLFRANCGAHRAGEEVLDVGAAGVLNEALRMVVSPGSGDLRQGTGYGGWRSLGLHGLRDRGWGGKTGTYQVEVAEERALSRSDWRKLRAWACGVEGIRPPRIPPGWGRITELASALAKAPAGSALGARTCEATSWPLNPAGVHRYRGSTATRKLDDLARLLARAAERKVRVYHSFVAVAPPSRGGWPEVESPAQGLVVAVLVDRETEDKSIAVKIAAELAAAAERWAASGGRGGPPPG